MVKNNLSQYQLGQCLSPFHKNRMPDREAPAYLLILHRDILDMSLILNLMINKAQYLPHYCNPNTKCLYCKFVYCGFLIHCNSLPDKSPTSKYRLCIHILS